MGDPVSTQSQQVPTDTPNPVSGPLTDGTDAGKPITYARFKEVNDKAKTLEDRAKELESKVSQYETYLTNPTVQEALKSATTPKGQQAQSTPTDDGTAWDPYDRKSIESAVARSIEAALSQHVKPIRDVVQRNLWDQQVRDAQSAFRGRADWTKDQAAVVRQIQEVPGLTVTEAWTLVKARQNGMDAAPAGYPGVETGSGSYAAGQVGSAGSDDLSGEEKAMAQRFQMTDAEYIAHKKMSDAIRAGKVPAGATA